MSDTSIITTAREGSIFVVTSNNPPVNALGAAVRTGLDAALTEFSGDNSLSAMVLICDGKTFFAGADITEFGKPPVMPQLPELLERMEALDKPVVAAIHGTALGGGCETLLCSHYRIAVPSAKIGVPEVKLGLLPGAGGTQRLPRIVGVAKAVEMTALGEPISAADALAAGLVDKLATEGNLRAEAIAFATDVAAVRPVPRISEKTATPDQPAIDAFLAKHSRRINGQDAPAANIACVEAATRLPFADGLNFEREQFMKLMFGTQSAALRHIFFAERKANKIDGIAADIALRPIAKVGVIGAGTMGGGISMNFLSVGIPVTIVEMAQDALDRGVGTIRKNYEATAAKGRMTAEQVEAAMAILTPALDLSALSDCDLIIEAVYESMDVKKEVFGKLDRIAKPGAILASNTSYLDVNEIAAATSRPADVLGLHFFSPANVMKLLEVVRGDKTADDVLATAMAIAKTIKKVAVVAGVCHGFIGNRMLAPRQYQAMDLLMEGATPTQIDAVHTEFGMPMGPFQMADLAGVDIGWHRDPARIESIRDALCAEDRWGQKKSAGFYDYDEKRTPSPSVRVQEIIDAFAAKAGKTKRVVTTEEIIERTLYPMVSEGALILSEGKAQRASDVDVVWVYGYGWPAWRGGPMFWADLEGAAKIVTGLAKHGLPVAPLLQEKADKGERFN
jgi:3-hydroxyacyl-CoA dehydrogenase